MKSVEPAFSKKHEGPSTLYVWMEPWCDEFELSAGSTIDLFVRGNPVAPLEIDETADQVTVWGSTGTLVEVYIDGEFQESGSSSIVVPDLGVLGPKGLVDVVFSHFPETRPGGQPRPKARGLGAWLRGLLRQ